MSNKLDLESLKAQLKTTEAEHEQAIAHLYRTDGVIALLKFQIASFADEPEKPSDPAGAVATPDETKKDTD